MEDAAELLRTLEETLSNHQNMKDAPITGERSYIQETTEDISLSCNRSRGHETEVSAKAERVNPNSPSHEGSVCLEKQKRNSEPPAPDPDVCVFAPFQLYEVASAELKMHIDIANGGVATRNPSLRAIERGIYSRLGELGCNPDAWLDAVETLTVYNAVLAGIITEAKITYPKHPVANAGGYLRGMTRAAKLGELQLRPSFMGLLKRRAQEEEEAHLGR